MIYNKEKKDEHDTIMNNLDQAVMVVFGLNYDISYINSFFKEILVKYSDVDQWKLEEGRVGDHSQEIMELRLFKEYVDRKDNEEGKKSEGQIFSIQDIIGLNQDEISKKVYEVVSEVG